MGWESAKGLEKKLAWVWESETVLVKESETGWESAMGLEKKLAWGWESETVLVKDSELDTALA